MLIIAAYILTLSLAIVTFIFSLLIGTSVISFIIARVPFALTPSKHVKKIDIFNLESGQNFYDLGCGDGRFYFFA